MEYFGFDSLIAKMPDIGKLTYIIGHFGDLGQASSNGFSIQPLSWSEVDSYAKINGIGNWESVLIHAMSRMYVSAKLTFDDVLCECPYRYEDKPMLELQLLASKGQIANKIN